MEGAPHRGATVYSTDVPIIFEREFSIKGPSDLVRSSWDSVDLESLKLKNGDIVKVLYKDVSTTFRYFSSWVQQKIARNEDASTDLAAEYEQRIATSKDAGERHELQNRLRMIANARSVINDYRPAASDDQLTDLDRCFIGNGYHRILLGGPPTDETSRKIWSSGPVDSKRYGTQFINQGEQDLVVSGILERRAYLKDKIATIPTEFSLPAYHIMTQLSGAMRTEVANQDVADEHCPGPLATPSDSTKSDCSQLLSALPKCSSQKFDLAAFDRRLAKQIADFHREQHQLDALSASWAARRKEVRDIMIADRARLGDQTPKVRIALVQLEEQEDYFYQDIDFVVLWGVNFAWGLDLFEAQGVPPVDQGPNYGGGRLPGQLDLMASRAAQSLAETHRAMFLANCNYHVAYHRWTIERTGSEAEANASFEAAKEAWMNCRRAEGRQRDTVAGPIRSMRDRLLDERGRLLSVIDSWRQFRTSGHFYVGEGAAAIDKVYAINEIAAKLGCACDTNTGAGGEPPPGQVAQARLPRDCSTGYQMASNGEAYPPDPQVKYPDIETSAFEFEVNLQRPLDIEGLISGAADTERP